MFRDDCFQLALECRALADDVENEIRNDRRCIGLSYLRNYLIVSCCVDELKSAVLNWQIERLEPWCDDLPIYPFFSELYHALHKIKRAYRGARDTTVVPLLHRQAITRMLERLDRRLVRFFST